MRAYTFEQTGYTGVLTFYGDLSGQRVSEVKSALMNALGNVDHVIFNLGKVRNLDFACLDLLRVAKGVSDYLHKRLTLVGLQNKPFERLFQLREWQPNQPHA